MNSSTLLARSSRAAGTPCVTRWRPALLGGATRKSAIRAASCFNSGVVIVTTAPGAVAPIARRRLGKVDFASPSRFRFPPLFTLLRSFEENAIRRGATYLLSLSRFRLKGTTRNWREKQKLRPTETLAT